jgi:hypothetical protein
VEWSSGPGTRATSERSIDSAIPAPTLALRPGKDEHLQQADRQGHAHAASRKHSSISRIRAFQSAADRRNTFGFTAGRSASAKNVVPVIAVQPSRAGARASAVASRRRLHIGHLADAPGRSPCMAASSPW